MKKIINSQLLFIVLAFLFPTVFLLSKNNYIYSSSQILSTLVFMFLIAVFVSFSIWLLSKIITKLLLYILLRRISPSYTVINLTLICLILFNGIFGFLNIFQKTTTEASPIWWKWKHHEKLGTSSYLIRRYSFSFSLCY